ncbi:hypothetical protein [Methylobacterium crusticola]|nr:hypothetical protein [Methylobacterium crusticola]
MAQTFWIVFESREHLLEVVVVPGKQDGRFQLEFAFSLLEARVRLPCRP